MAGIALSGNIPSQNIVAGWVISAWNWLEIIGRAIPHRIKLFPIGDDRLESKADSCDNKIIENCGQKNDRQWHTPASLPPKIEKYSQKSLRLRRYAAATVHKINAARQLSGGVKNALACFSEPALI
jgi:hypothetical protein